MRTVNFYTHTHAHIPTNQPNKYINVQWSSSLSQYFLKLVPWSDVLKEHCGLPSNVCSNEMVVEFS